MISKLSVHESKLSSQCSCPVFLPVCHQILITIAIMSLSNNNYFLIQSNCEARLIYSAKNSHVSCTNQIFFHYKSNLFFITNQIFFHYKSNLFSLQIKSFFITNQIFFHYKSNLYIFFSQIHNPTTSCLFITSPTVSTHKRCHLFWMI